MSRRLLVIAVGTLSPSLKIDSSTDNSVEVVSRPVNAIQSLTTIPAPTSSEPRFTVPAMTGTWSSEASSRWVSGGVLAATSAPLDERAA